MIQTAVSNDAMKTFKIRSQQNHQTTEFTVWTKTIDGNAYVATFEVLLRSATFSLKIPENPQEEIELAEQVPNSENGLFKTLPTPDTQIFDTSDYAVEFEDGEGARSEDWSVESSSKHVTDEDLSNLLAEIEQGYEEEYEDYLDNEGWELDNNYFVLEGGLLITEA